MLMYVLLLTIQNKSINHFVRSYTSRNEAKFIAIMKGSD
jgi:hypothetical protein